MIELRPGMMGVLPNVWRMRVVEGRVILEGSYDNGTNWMSWVEVPTGTVNTSVPFKFIGQIQQDTP